VTIVRSYHMRAAMQIPNVRVAYAVDASAAALERCATQLPDLSYRIHGLSVDVGR
jgi:predicted dehydrogenase